MFIPRTPNDDSKLTGDAAAAVEHRGSHLQIIAAAGSGKTEVVSQRVVSLLADGIPARSIVAFTFTERAAAELKERITERVEDRLGKEALDRVGGVFVGTIHAFCFQLLQRYVPRYETYDVLEENQLNAFLARESNRIGVKEFDPAGRQRLYASVAEFRRGLDIVENEILTPNDLEEPFASAYLAYLDHLERYRLLSFGQQIVRAVEELRKPEVQAEIHGDLLHLIVDEYQDVNPAQEELIRLLTGPQTEVCVVGDDDQAIYGWRGSDISNIVSFAQRYSSVATFELMTNRDPVTSTDITTVICSVRECCDLQQVRHGARVPGRHGEGSTAGLATQKTKMARSSRSGTRPGPPDPHRGQDPHGTDHWMLQPGSKR